ncbi:class I SAM-dependent methyltransferase [Actinoplanes sp. NPDC051851]|uniref:class I SAM-dependent methyltransferase n=1 Tax=Actinoplanes sp. NPDC051851 TaxID=3154753 RepID=UPI00342A5616
MPTNEFETQPHQLRAVAESFGVDPERYDRARPPYPKALIERLVANGPEVLDVGCGTGIEARQFQAAGCTVLGVEPDARMADFARRAGVAVEVGTIEGWESRGRMFDLVVAGTAWHWVDPVAGAAKAASVLRAGGRLAPFWHVFQVPEELREPLATVFRTVLPQLPPAMAENAGGTGLAGYQPLLDRAADGMHAAGAFGEVEQWEYAWERVYTRDEWLDLLPTSGGLTRLPPPKVAELLAALGVLLDEMGGSFTMSYTSVVVTAVRLG